MNSKLTIETSLDRARPTTKVRLGLRGSLLWQVLGEKWPQRGSLLPAGRRQGGEGGNIFSLASLLHGSDLTACKSWSNIITFLVKCGCLMETLFLQFFWCDHMNDINGDGNNGIATSASLAVCGLPSMSMDNYSLPASPLLLIPDWLWFRFS